MTAAPTAVRRRLRLRPEVFLFALVLLPAILAGQPRRDERALYEPVPPFRCEAWSAPSTDPGVSRLDIHLWFRPSVLVFVRNSRDTSSPAFVGRAELSIEVFDSAHVLRYRKYLRREVASATSDAAAMPDTELTVSAAAVLPPGLYTVNAEVSDAESQRRVTRRLSVTLGAFPPDSLRASSIFWCQPAPQEPLLTGEALFGGILPLGRQAVGYIACTGIADPPAASVVFRLFRVRPDAPDRTLLFADTLQAPAYRREVPVPDTLEGCRYAFDAAPSGAVTFLIPIRSDTLPQGSYSAEVSIAAGARRTAVAQGFDVAWPRMPRSLASLTTAVRPLEYLMTKESYAAIKDMKPAPQREAFEAFWRGKNPAPGNAMNDVMGEFYRRVDVAGQEFSTIRQPDGARSDRGKIFILYGPPTTRERVLGTSAPPREIWYYALTRKSVLFVDEKRTGDYTLTTEQ
jgi:GWxTD domain-containing protein